MSKSTSTVGRLAAVALLAVLALAFALIAGVSKKLSLGREHGFDDEKSGNLFFEIVRLIERRRNAADPVPRERQEPELARRGQTRSRSSCASSRASATTSRPRSSTPGLGSAAPRADLHDRPAAGRLRRAAVRVSGPPRRRVARSCGTILETVGRPASTSLTRAPVGLPPGVRARSTGGRGNGFGFGLVGRRAMSRGR